MRHAALIFCAGLFLSGCQQMAWKPGAGSSDLKSDTAICRGQVADEAAVPDCLQRRGWVIRQRPVASDEDVAEAAAETAESSEVESASAMPVAAPIAATGVQPASVQATAGQPTPAQSTTVQSTPVQSSTARPLAEAAPVSPAAAAAAAPISTTVPAASNKSVPAKPAVVDPLAKKVRQAWWKTGAQASDLAADEADCVDKLGPAHQPDLQKRLYTRGMIDCLKAHGWSGY
ncbi:MAG TPA: hypothetical protein VLC91_09405 [Spongiibacteraceae bacterium]|nr:hypothetical protein [Spongiibacteraceae bacterium]